VFEFLFKYPASAFSNGTVVLLGSWPRWLLFATIAAAAGLLAWMIWRRRGQSAPSLRGLRVVIIWGLEALTLTLLLIVLWQPAISVTSLRPQQNIVAVVVDDSRSMGIADTGKSREQIAAEVLNGDLLKRLQSRFQVRLYRMGGGLDRIQDATQLHATQPATRIGKALHQIAEESATLPIGAVVLLSDGSDNTGGIDLETLNALAQRRLPVNTIGIGNTELTNDVELDGFGVPAKALPGSRLQAQITIRQSGFVGKHARLIVSGGGAILDRWNPSNSMQPKAAFRNLKRVLIRCAARRTQRTTSCGRFFRLTRRRSACSMWKESHAGSSNSYAAR
jgi:hypothetical protein